MKTIKKNSLVFPTLSLALAATMLAATTSPARAQSDEGFAGEESASTVNEAKDDGPVRLARFSFLSGDVTWREDASAEWQSGTINMPVREGAQIFVRDGGRAEVQFDDGSLLRIGAGALVTLSNLYSDAEGEFTQIKVQDGIAALRIRHERSVYQLDTPFLTVKASGPASLRVGVGDDVEVSVRSGKAVVEASNGQKNLVGGDYLRMLDAEDGLEVSDAPRPDDFERWSDERDRSLATGIRETQKHVPANVAIVAQDLDNYGDWRNDEEYGNVWVPRGVAADWRPYYDGRWSYVAPFGWTWVSNERWGWAPYHYGSWIHRGWGWSWVPGPVTQCWNPGVVNFCDYGGNIAWVPLAPREIVYPTTIGFGFGSRHSNWSLFFSIGSAGVYYYDRDRFVTRPWRSGYVNRQVTIINNTTIVNGRPGGRVGFDMNRNTYASNRYIPYNARNGYGGSMASSADFQRGVYRRMSRNDSSVFTSGRNVGAPIAGAHPASGPASIRPVRGGIGNVSRTNVPSASTTQRRTFGSSRGAVGNVGRPPTTADRMAQSTGRGSDTPRTGRPTTGSETGFPRSGNTGRTNGSTTGRPGFPGRDSNSRTDPSRTSGSDGGVRTDRSQRSGDEMSGSTGSVRRTPRTDTSGTGGGIETNGSNRSNAADAARRARTSLYGRGGSEGSSGSAGSNSGVGRDRTTGSNSGASRDRSGTGSTDRAYPGGGTGSREGRTSSENRTYRQEGTGTSRTTRPGRETGSSDSSTGSRMGGGTRDTTGNGSSRTTPEMPSRSNSGGRTYDRSSGGNSGSTDRPARTTGSDGTWGSRSDRPASPPRTEDTRRAPAPSQDNSGSRRGGSDNGGSSRPAPDTSSRSRGGGGSSDAPARSNRSEGRSSGGSDRSSDRSSGGGRRPR